MAAADPALRESAQRALKLMDFTTLADDDTHDRVKQLCVDAQTPFGCTAAVCIYPQFIGTAKAALRANSTPQVRVATVVNFPHGGDDADKAVQETRAAVAAGADEVDVVLPYRRLLAGDEEVCADLVAKVKSACPEGVLLKVILETGELKTAALIRRASEIAIGAGADFIKTSTGKVAVNATLESAEIMLTVIRDFGVQSKVGFKPAGGVKTAQDAKAYLDLADKILGPDWVDQRHFRFGASSLRPALLSTLQGGSGEGGGGY